MHCQCSSRYQIKVVVELRAKATVLNVRHASSSVKKGTWLNTRCNSYLTSAKSFRYWSDKMDILFVPEPPLMSSNWYITWFFEKWRPLKAIPRLSSITWIPLRLWTCSWPPFFSPCVNKVCTPWKFIYTPRRMEKSRGVSRCISCPCVNKFYRSFNNSKSRWETLPDRNRGQFNAPYVNNRAGGPVQRGKKTQ